MKTSFAEFKQIITEDKRFRSLYIDCEKVVAVFQHTDHHGNLIDESSIWMVGCDEPFFVTGNAEDILNTIKTYCKEK